MIIPQTALQVVLMLTAVHGGGVEKVEFITVHYPSLTCFLPPKAVKFPSFPSKNGVTANIPDSWSSWV